MQLINKRCDCILKIFDYTNTELRSVHTKKSIIVVRII